MKGICFFFRAAKPLEKGKRRNDNDEYTTIMKLGHNCFTARSTRRENCWPLTPLSITTHLGMPCSLLTQCRRRNLEPGPLNTYRGWLELKRQVRKGEKGITLCMPMQYKKRVPKDNEQEEESEETTRSTFGFRAYWFVLAQTDGEAMDNRTDSGI